MIEVESNLHLQFPSTWHRLLLDVPLVRAQENQTVQVLLPAVHAHLVADEPVQLFCGRYFENQDHRNWTWSPFLCMKIGKLKQG